MAGSFWISRAVVLTSILCVAAGCSDTNPTRSLDVPEPEGALESRATSPADPVERLALGVALALADPAMTRHVLEDLRDSPFSGHSLHLGSYFRGRRGVALAAAAARALGTTPAALLASLADVPELELVMDRPYDRAEWTGTADVAIVGTSRSFPELYAAAGSRARVTAYTAGGQARVVGLDEYFGPPLLLIHPAESRFGPDPEAKRAAAPRRSGNTISTREEEFATQAVCDPETVREPCPEESGGNTNHGGYWLSHSYGACLDAAGHADADQDGIRDACEYEIARQFAPGLRFDAGEQWWQRDSYWSVRRSNIYPNAISVFYLIGYHRDNGDVVFGGWAHDGDSEFISIAVRDLTGTGRWVLEEATYSAHWHHAWDRTDDRTYSENVQWSDGTYRGRPRAWVGESKHPNYFSQSACNDHLDNCNNPQSSDTNVNVDPARNIGNNWAAGIRLHTSPCAGTWRTDLPYTECFWTDDTFRGWQSENGGGAGGYRHSLEWYAY
jgi:hypothetical protein